MGRRRNALPLGRDLGPVDGELTLSLSHVSGAGPAGGPRAADSVEVGLLIGHDLVQGRDLDVGVADGQGLDDNITGQG